MRLYTSNRLEVLADRLADVVAEPGPSPLESETIVVRSRGMERWLSMRLATDFGVWANGHFPFPNVLVWDAFRATLPHLPETDAWDPDVLTWRVMKDLPGLLERPAFQPLHNYMEGDDDGLKRFQLAGRIAHLFDQYTVFRPDLLSRWDEGLESDGEDWQAELWRTLTARDGSSHKAALRRDFHARAAANGLDAMVLPDRISIFGISALPPLHLEVFHALAGRSDVHLFLLDPCREYWLDLFSERSVARAVHQKAGSGVGATDLHLETGHPLLASTGKSGRDFLARVLDLPGTQTDERFEDPGDDTLLHCLQSDILRLHDRGPDQHKALAHDDRSVQVHSCHGPMREIEVLHDQILDLLQDLPELEPRDVLVMTPDIESYAPFINAVFEGQEPGRRIPYSIADRSARGTNPVADAFVRVLGLHGGRFTATEVLDLLELPAIRCRFKLQAGDLDGIRDWVRDAGIRWGLDGPDRARHGLPAFEDNSWRAGLDRLLLGYALPGDDTRLFEGILPCDRVEGEEANVLGRFVDFAEQLFQQVRSLGEERPLACWADDLQALVAALFLADDETQWETGQLDHILDELRTLQTTAAFDEKCGLDVVRAWLTQRLERDPMNAGFLTGGVTFSAMVPMRSIPFRVIALVGMNDGAFPRQARPVGFDLMARHPAPGDPSRRDEDRYLFLEALLSARDGWYLSYVGQSIKDNTEVPPSVLISELLDAAAKGFTASDDGDVLDQVVTRHRLQAFNPAYFDQRSNLFSYSVENLQAVQAGKEPGGAPGPFVTQALSGADEGLTDVSVRDLAAFLANPAKHFLTRRLGVWLGHGADTVEEREPFSLEGLERYQMGLDLVRWSLEGRNPEELYAVVRASGLLPPGTPGQNAFESLKGEVDGFVKGLAPLLEGPDPRSVSVDLSSGGVRITGEVPGVIDDRLVRFRMASLKTADRLKGWVEHLVLGAANRGSSFTTHVVGRNQRAVFLPGSGGTGALDDLVDLYREGLTRPLPFFPESAWTYANALDGGEDNALRKASGVFAGSDYLRGESEDVWILSCFRRTGSLDTEFKDLATRILTPLMAAQEVSG